MLDIINRTESIVSIVSNLIETGVINTDEIDKTMTALQRMDDSELASYLIESHQLRENVYAINAFRNKN